MSRDYGEKYSKISAQTKLALLDRPTQGYIQKKAFQYRFTFQELKQIVEISIDLSMWDEGSLLELDFQEEHKRQFLKSVHGYYEDLKVQKEYRNFDYEKPQRQPELVLKEKGKLGLGSCPVASERTRCCNLLTLDAVESCGFDCSYCAIGSFYNEDRVTFDPDFEKKLKNLELDPDKTYHIGTGQSSDSLLFGNKNNTLQALFDFANTHGNVILELKSKSKNISYLLEHKIPKNVITSWSINTPTIIENEEHLSASLEERLESARAIANKGNLVGFHFHPMVHYDGWESEYQEVVDMILKKFVPEEVALISLGTLTFIKPVIKKLRERNFKSKILQMPLESASGKFSYPLETKKQMFSHLYSCFEPWQREVYFYLCMEDISLWAEVFGYEYVSNSEFENDMINSYNRKINK